MKLNRKTAWEHYLGEAKSVQFLEHSSQDTVLNGSFENGREGMPKGWQLAAGAFGDSTEWCAAGGVDDGRCLRISPRGGGASWYSAPVPVSAGAEYVFRCAIKREGNRHWAHACEINWVSLVFYDAAGAPLRRDAEHDQPLVLIRTRQTGGWVEAWRYLDAPAEAATLVIGFRIVRGEPDMDDPYGFRRYWHGEIDSGDWCIDDVRLERMPLAVSPATGALTIHVTGGAARLRVANTHGETFSPRNSISYKEQGGCFHPLRDNVRLLLPPGNYVVEALRGFQREPYQKTVEIVEGHETRLAAELPRVADWPGYGWFTGDHHNHLSFHGATRHPLMTIDDVCHIARGEGLDYLSFCGELVDQHAYAEWLEAGRPSDARPDGAYERDDFIGCVSHEVTHDLLGHVCLINPPGRVMPGHPWWLAPTNAELTLAVRRGDALGTRGAVVMAHPYDGLDRSNLCGVLSDAGRTAVHRELPVDIALGFGDTMDFLAVEHPGDIALRFQDYFRLLNLGMRIGVSGASDAYADQGTEIVGSLVTFARADRLDMNAIAAAYEFHRTMTSNGPLLRFRMNRREVGETVRGAVLEIEAKAFSNWGITRLEVIANGEVIADASPGDDGWAYIRAETVAPRSGWAIARVWGPGHPYLNTQPVSPGLRAEQGQCAVTSPIYIEVPGRPLVPRREDAEYFLHWIDACCEAIRGRKAVLQGRGPYGPEMRDEDVKKALDLFRRGRDLFEDLL